MEPQSLADADEAADTRLSSLIAQAARTPLDRVSSIAEPRRAHADQAFSEIAAAIERARERIDPRSDDARVLQRLRDVVALRTRTGS